jgi:type VI secretion system secreted protein VgrG
MNDVALPTFALTLPESPPFPVEIIELVLHDPLDEPFAVEIVVHSTEHDLAPTDVVGRPLLLSMPSAGRPLVVSALVVTLRQETTEPTGVSRYRLVAMAPLWLASRRVEHRIFQHASAVDIVAEVLRGYDGRIPEPVLRLERSYPSRDYVAQYGETDLAFVCRILAEEGIALCHLHDGSGAPVLFDNAALLPKSEPLLFRQASDLRPAAPHVSEAAFEASVASSRVTLRDYDYERPAVALEALAIDPSMGASEEPLERYEFEVGRFRDPLNGQALALTRLEEQRWPADRAVMRASVPLGAGSVFLLVGHPRPSANREWLVVRSRARSRSGSEELFEVEAIPFERSYRPRRLPKPRVIGTQTAFVVGAPGEEIDVDALGRVCLRFRWDRRGKSHETTRRARVSQASAGPGYGHACLPRVGDEVVVDFLDGDPDEPLVIGRVHNGQSPTPRPLPADKAVSTWRSRSTPGGDGYNEIALEDDAGRERIFVHAERDLVVEVENDARITVGGDVERVVRGSTVERVTGSERRDVDGDVELHAGNVRVHAEDVVFRVARFGVAANVIVLLGGGAAIRIGEGNIKMAADGNISMAAGGDVSISAGGNVDVDGTLIKLNS